MSQNRLELQGMVELRVALRQLPETLTAEAADIVLSNATQAEGEIVSGYPTGPTGNLKRRVTIERSGSRLAAVAVIRSGARHAHLFEYGTTRRQTAKGANRGVMPAAPEAERMIPKVIRWRRTMTAELIALVRRAGFEVTA